MQGFPGPPGPRGESTASNMDEMEAVARRVCQAMIDGEQCWSG